MNCDEFQELLSIYHDGELDSERRAELEVHLERCNECSRDLAALRQISAATKKLIARQPHPELWQRIDASLGADSSFKRVPEVQLATMTRSADLPSPGTLQRRIFVVAMCTAIIMLIGIGINWSNSSNHHGAHEHAPLLHYIEHFVNEPELAQQRLAEKYKGSTVSVEEAVQLVGYRPSNIQAPPKGFTREALYVLDMPCCKCIEAFWKRGDGSCIAIFEHSEAAGDWFKGRPSVQVSCGGKTCRVVELEGCFAASWRLRKRMITLIGIRDTEELTALVSVFKS